MATIGELTNIGSLLPAHDERAIYRGDVYYIDLEGVEYASRYLARKIRPALIIQNNMGNERSETVIVAPMTSQYKKPYPFQYRTEFNGKQCVVLFEQLLTLDKFRILEHLGTFTETQMRGADQALMYSLNLNRFSLENVIGFNVTNKITKETRQGISVYVTVSFQFRQSCDEQILVSMASISEFDSALHAGSGLDAIQKSLDTCRGLHWIVAHREYINL